MTKCDHCKGAEARQVPQPVSHSMVSGREAMVSFSLQSGDTGSLAPSVSGGLCFLVFRVGGAALTWSLRLAGWARWASWWDVVPGRLGWHREEGSVSGFRWPVAFSCQALGSCGERLMAVPSS